MVAKVSFNRKKSDLFVKKRSNMELWNFVKQVSDFMTFVRLKRLQNSFSLYDSGLAVFLCRY